MNVKKKSLEKSDIFRDERDLNIIVLGCNDTTVSLTQGKIVLWFGRQTSESLIHDILFGISSIDSTVTMEYEIICGFKNIVEYENRGYILTSYARTKGGYRVIFNVPFSKKAALVYVIKSIMEQLQEKDLRKTIHWDGSREKIIFICNKLIRLDGWDISRIEFKEAIK